MPDADAVKLAEAQAGEGLSFSKIALFVAKFAIAGGIIVWLLHRDFHKFVDSLSSARPLWLAAAAVFLFLQFASCAFRWRLLLSSQGIKAPFHEVFSLYLQGAFFSLAIPGGAVGGDLVKAGIIASRAPEGKGVTGVLSVLVDRVAGMVALFSLALLLTPFSFGIINRLAPGMKTAFLFLIAISVCGLVCAALCPFYEFFARLKAFALLQAKLDKLSKGAFGRVLDAARLYKAQWKSVLGAIAVSLFVANPLQIACLFCLVAGVSGGSPDLFGVSLAALFGGAASSIPVTPGGIGTRDAVAKCALIACGLDAGAATAAPLVFTTLMVALSLFGGLLFAFDSIHRKKA